MGDLSSEPSMEEILSSIKRIIAEEGEAAPGRGRRAGRAAPPVVVEDEVLELSDPMPQDRPADAIRAELPRTAPRHADPVHVEEPAAAAPTAAEPEDEPRQVDPAPSMTAGRGSDRPAPASEPERTPIVSSGTLEAMRGALDQLSRLMVKPEPGADGTLEGLVREMLRPMLRDWLDTHLPALVEDMVAREIEKITSSRR